MFMLLAFLCHTVLQLGGHTYQRLRAQIKTKFCLTSGVKCGILFLQNPERLMRITSQGPDRGTSGSGQARFRKLVKRPGKPDQEANKT
jgi:hypothetical protein